MLWLVLILGVIGGAFYIIDKRIKEKFRADDKFDPEDWDLPKSVELPTDIKPQVVLPASNTVEKISYEKKHSVLAREHGIFFNALQKAIGTEHQILTNINAADVLSVVANNNALIAQVATKNISAKQFDFVLCEKESLSPVCIILLDDNLDSLLINTCESASLPIARFRMQIEYDVDNLKKVISQALGENKKPTDEVSDTPSEKVINDSLDIKSVENTNTVKADTTDTAKEEMTANGIDLKLCPNCSAVMLKRKAKNGENAGKLFWLCSTYPSCRGMRAV